MPFPPYVLTRTVTVGGAAILESADLMRIRLTVTASRSLIHADTGYRFKNQQAVNVSELGTDAVLSLPRTDLPGWKNAVTGDIIDVSAEGVYTHQYIALVEYLDADGNSKGISPDQIGPFVLPAGDGAVDLDKIVPVGSSSGEAVSIPAWFAEIAAQAQAAADEARAAVLDSTEFVRKQVAEPGPVRQELTATIGAAFTDDGARARARAAVGLNCVAYIAGDSTAAAGNGWPVKWLGGMTELPALSTVHIGWDDATQALKAPVTVKNGAATPVTSAADTFSRSAAELIGTSPDTGSAWQNPGASAGTWSLDGSNVVRTSAATAPEVYFRGSVAGDMVSTFAGSVLSTVGAGGGVFRFNRYISNYVDTNNYLFAQVGVSPAGGRSFGLYKRIGAVNTLIGSEVTDPAEIPFNNAAASLPDVTVVLDGTNIRATIGATTVTGTLSTAERDTLRAGNGIGLRADNQSGMKIAGVSATVLSAAEVNTLTVYNGSLGGSTLAYQLPRMAAQCPVTPDVVMVASGHNYATTTADYLASVAGFVEAARERWPNAGIVIVGQNPRFPPAGANGNLAHLERLAAVRALASAKGWGFIPVAEAFHKRPDQGRSFFGPADGVHPLDAGYAFWGSVVASWFQR